jgi:hypothetical protein
MTTAKATIETETVPEQQIFDGFNTVITPKYRTIPEQIVPARVTLVLTPDAAECLFGQISGLNCSPLGSEYPEFNWHLHQALSKAGVDKGPIYQGAYAYVKSVGA